MFHGVRALSQPLLKMMPSPSVKNRRKNHSYGDVDIAITKIQTGEITQAKAVHKYLILRRILERKCKNKRDNVEEKRPGSFPMMGQAEEKDLVK